MENPSKPILRDRYPDVPLQSEGDRRSEAAPGRLAGTGPLAVIDIGSNSVRLVVYERLARAPTPLFNEKALCGLGRGISTTGRLDREAVASALSSIRRFFLLAAQMQVTELFVFATAAVRDASNGGEFVAAVEGITGGTVVLLSGAEEARLSALGVVSGIHKPDGVAGDLGGGSLEVIDIGGNAIGRGETFPLGGLRLEESSAKTMVKAEQIVTKSLAASTVLKGGRGRAFYAIGGTWRSLARLHMRQRNYPLRVMHHYRIDTAEAAEFCRIVARSEVESLPAIEAVSKSRRPLLPYGAAVLRQIIEEMRPSEIVLSALGVREGHLYDILPAAEQGEDALLSACRELATLASRSPGHAHELGPWTDGALAAIRLDETADERRLRMAACLIADIGWRAHPDYRGEQALNIIAHAAFIGIDHPGRAYLALSAFYRHQGLGEEASPSIRGVATPRLMERARALGAAMRVAYMISGAMTGVLPRTRIEARGKTLTLVLPPDLEPLTGERVSRRLQQLGKLAGLETAVMVEG